nr:MAG TPA: hypothetical protein [Caudoviricetes sp.]
MYALIIFFFQDLECYRKPSPISKNCGVNN